MLTPTHLHLYGLIGPDITAASLQAQLDQIDPISPLVVRINSDGGSVAEGMAIFAMLRQWPGTVTTEVVGWALSVASVILLAGTVRRVHETSLVMVHAPWTPAGGNALELRQQAEVLDTVAQSMRAAYAQTGQPSTTVERWFDGADHWFTADQALAAGLATEVVTAAAAAAAIPSGIYAARHPLPSHIAQRFYSMPAPAPAPGSHHPAAPSPAGAQGQAAIEAAARQAEAHRRTDIRAHFDVLRNRNDIDQSEALALQRQCEDDLNCTALAAGQRVLALMARGVTPANPQGYAPEMFSSTHDRLAEFQAAAADVLLIRGGIRVAEPHPAARDLRRMSVVEIAARLMSMTGQSTRDMNPGQIIKAGLSTSDFPNLLANVAGKALRVGYQNAPATFTGWTGEREVPDYKPATLVNLSEAPGLLKVPELGEYKFGAMTDSATTFQASKFGRVLLISREAMLNDDLGAFTSLPQAWGNAARRLEADQVYGVLQSSANLPDGNPLFHASRGNLAAAGAAPSIASIGLARAAMRQQKNIGGLEYLDPQPRFLIVPVALETACEQLLASLKDPATSSGGVNAPTPEWIRGLQLVADPRLDAVSPIIWYLAANPQQIETIVRAYITGEDRPHIEEDREFQRDALSMKARLDLAVGVIDWRGLYKNPGA